MGLLSIGQRVFVRNEQGIVKFIGKTQFAPGVWIGVELREPNGKNTGIVNDVKYFECEKKDGNYGVFVREALVDSEAPTGEAEPGIDASKLEKIISKLQSKLKTSNEDVAQLKTRIEDLKEDVTKHQSRYSSLESKLEMVTTDKEFLEESNHKMTKALNDLQLKYDELRTDFQIMSEEVELNKQIEEEIKSQMQHSDATDIDYQAILSRNRSLEIALTNLQRITNENDMKLKRKIDELNNKLVGEEKDAKSYTQLLQNLSIAQETIQFLQSQLDSTFDLEKMVEHLNLENDNLNVKLTALTKTVEELTELHELDKSLEENQALVEKDLRNNISSLSTVISENESLIHELQKANKYMESKIFEFKGRSSDLPKHDETTNELSSQLESLKLELRQSKSSSFSHSVAHDLANSKSTVFQRHMGLQNINNANQKRALEILLAIDSVISDASVISRRSSWLIEEKNNYPKSKLFILECQFNVLSSFLKRIFTLWEFNFLNERYVAVSREFQERVLVLQTAIDDTISHFRESDFDKVNTDYTKEFVQDVVTLMELDFFWKSRTGVHFQNSSSLYFLLESYHYEALSSLKIASLLIGYFEKNPSEKQDKFLNDTIKSLNSIISINEKIINESTEMIEPLKKAFQNGNDLEISLKCQPDFCTEAKELGMIVQQLTEILKSTEVEEYSFGGTIKSPSSKVFASLYDALQSRILLFDVEISDDNKVKPSIFKTNNKEELSNSNINNKAGEELRLIKPKLTEISNKSMEKDKIIQDLRLNIQILHDNMDSNGLKNRNYINDIQQQLAQFQEENEKTKERHNELIETNKKLELEMKELLDSNRVFESGNISGGFINLRSEKSFNANMALMEEIIVLRKLVKLKNSNQNDYPDEDSLSWLKSPLLKKTNDKNLRYALSFERCSASLRGISKQVSLVQVPTNYTIWQLKACVPKYMTSLLEERSKNYQQQKKLALSLSLN